MKNDLSREYLPGIDGLRAIAVISVIIGHSGLVPFFKGAFTGVDIFFVISGYVISRSIYNRPFSGFVNYISSFYARRVKRIIPALAVCLAITFVATVMFVPVSWSDNTITNTGLAAFSGISNFMLAFNGNSYYAPTQNFNPFLHTWSLGVEEQFYLIFPAIFFLWIKFRNSKQFKILLNALLPALCALSLIVACIGTTFHKQMAFYLLPARFWELAAGVILFQLHTNGIFFFKKNIFRKISLISGVLLLTTGFIFTEMSTFPFWWAIVPVSGTFLLINGTVADNARKSFVTKFLDSRIMAYIGRISYSLYLWHWPVAVLLRWTVGLNTILLAGVYVLLTLLFSVISYHFIETSFRSGSFLKDKKNWVLIGGGLSILLIMSLISIVVINSGNVLSLSVTKDGYVWRSGWHWKDAQQNPVNDGYGLKGRKIFALGDSHSAAYRTMLHIVSRQIGVESHVYEQGDCAVAGLLEPISNSESFSSFYKESVAEIKKLATPGDIIFLASLRMPELSGRFEAVDIPSVVKEFNSPGSSKKRQAAFEEACVIINDLQDIGLTVLIEAPEPVLKVPPYRCSDWFNSSNPIAAPGKEISRSFLSDLRQPVMDSIKALQGKFPGLHVFDPFEILCKDEVFTPYDSEGLPVFYDGDHLSANGNRILAPSFRKKILEIWNVDKPN